MKEGLLQFLAFWLLRVYCCFPLYGNNFLESIFSGRYFSATNSSDLEASACCSILTPRSDIIWSSFFHSFFWNHGYCSNSEILFLSTSLSFSVTLSSLYVSISVIVIPTNCVFGKKSSR